MAKIQPGLERIAALLKNVSFPWRSIHVAGTNGKGSVCHYASSMLVGRSLKVGKFTSPHLVDRWDCISIDGRPIEEGTFRKVENHFLKVNKTHQIGASPFEILTATAFTIFNDRNVEVGVVEVGMGGKLDSTNILTNQAVSVVSKIARDHEGFLGNTLAEIAGHKAGILRPAVPYIINSANEANVQTVIQDYARAIGAGPRLLSTSFELNSRLYDTSKWQRATASLVPFQQENLKLAVVAVMQALQTMEQETRPTELAKTLLLNAKKHHPGRQEMVYATPVFRKATERKNHILVDGAHNPDAASALDDFIRINLRFGSSPAKERPASGWPVTWVLAMTEGKDARQYLATLLKPGDKVVTTTFGPVDGMPWVKPMDPRELLEVAKSVEPQITGVHVPVMGPLRALCTAKYMSNQMAPWSPIALTGSLYLVGDLHRELRSRSSRTWWTDTDEATAADRESFLKVQAEERKRVDAILSSKKAGAASEPEDPDTDEQRKLQEELDALNREVQRLEIEEKRLARDHSAILDTPEDEQSLSAAERLEREDRRFAELHSTPEQIAAQIARAEKAEADLARHAEKLEAAAKARAEKTERRTKQKERLEERRARKKEKRQFEAEQRMLRTGGGPRDGKVPKKVYLKEQASHPAQKSQERRNPYTDSNRELDALSILTTNRAKGFSFPKANAAKEAVKREAINSMPTRHVKPQDALSALSTPDQKNSFFGKPDPPTPSASPSTAQVTSNPEAPQTQSTRAARLTPTFRNSLRDQASSPTLQRSGSKPSEQKLEKQDLEEKKRNTVRIHMHYANVSEPRRARIASFPLDRRTRAWTAPRERSHPGYKSLGYKSVVNYYAHEYGNVRRRRE
ncbi:FolC bifunctional protein [Macroventuria anomochaeta]|uniref:FolC bifunctional protein n=1 Tax=Macroventuria anomochaeta TaxID=301207 RepID=A0ACB6RTT3_9PLEO|nr:FolC bifunctional protein [Macroventuria anomochaeta]KAF2625321.1 FolC bifunctional protein [Macroventuria anomochaeta]